MCNGRAILWELSTATLPRAKWLLQAHPLGLPQRLGCLWAVSDLLLQQGPVCKQRQMKPDCQTGWSRLPGTLTFSPPGQSCPGSPGNRCFLTVKFLSFPAQAGSGTQRLFAHIFTDSEPRVLTVAGLQWKEGAQPTLLLKASH